MNVNEPDDKNSLKITDFEMEHNVSAKTKNYDVKDAAGNIYKFIEGTKIQNAEVFAGMKTKRPLHDGVPEGLTKQFGGKPENWQHAKGNVVIDYFGEERKAEVHWFQEPSIGKVKFIIKRWLE